MAKKKLPPEQKTDSKTAEKDSVSPKKVIENWAEDRESDIYIQCEKFYDQIQKAYKNKEEADEGIDEYWNIYNATSDDNQTYQGNGHSYIPAVRNAVNARTKRALKQNFPVKYKHVDAIGTDGQKPYPVLALLEHYIRSTKLKSIVRSMYVSGDVTGQWNLYVDWLRDIRNVSNFIRRNPVVETLEGEASDPVNEEEVIEDQEVVNEGPTITDFATEDLVVIPPTCNDIEKANLVCLKLRLDKAAVEQFVDDGVFILPEDSDISEWINDNKGKEKRVPPKKRASDAGIKTEGTLKYALIYEATARLEFEKGKKSLAYIYFAGENEIIGIIKAPQWGQKRPIISAPVDRVSGSFFGISKIESVKWLQWDLNDFWNMGRDSGFYSMLPIVMTDPEKNPNYAMMVYGLAAVWPVSPQSTQFAQFPQMWKDAVEMSMAIEAQINKALDVSDMMMGKSPSGRKNAQAVGAQMQEQSVPILDHAERFEEEILNPLMERFFEYDAQFREEDLTVLTMGEIGVRASMQVIEPIQWENRYYFQWQGTEYVMNMQRMQQQIATMNVLRGIPPQQLNGLKLDISPILEILVNNVWGSELQNRILIDDRNKFMISPEIEDEMMINGIPVEVHESDNDPEHIQKHQVAAQVSSDPSGIIRAHMQMHYMAMQKKIQMQMGAQQQQGGAQGVPGGSGPGVAGTPRMGGQPQMSRPGQQPAGGIHPDQIAGGIPRG